MIIRRRDSRPRGRAGPAAGPGGSGSAPTVTVGSACTVRDYGTTVTVTEPCHDRRPPGSETQPSPGPVTADRRRPVEPDSESPRLRPRPGSPLRAGPAGAAGSVTRTSEERLPWLPVPYAVTRAPGRWAPLGGPGRRRGWKRLTRNRRAGSGDP
jgi:hypothetical protein